MLNKSGFKLRKWASNRLELISHLPPEDKEMKGILPRLELNGALLLAKLARSTIYDMQLQDVPVYLWADDTIVLQWITEHPSKWKTYVANRVAEIQEVLPSEHWNHVPTKENLADLASRGVTTKQLINNNLWWYGPEWLSKDQIQWPKGPL